MGITGNLSDISKSAVIKMREKLAGHVAGETDRHAAEDVDYSGVVEGAENVKEALEQTAEGLEEHRTAEVLDHVDGSVTAAKLAAAAVTEGKIADSAVTEEKLANGSVTDEKIGSRTVQNPESESGTVTGTVTELFNAETEAIRAAGAKADTKQTEWLATTEDGDTNYNYSVTLSPAPEELYVGMKITIIPHKSSTSTRAMLNVNGFGNKLLRVPVYGSTEATVGMPPYANFLKEGKAVSLMYDGLYWVLQDYCYTRPSTSISDDNEKIPLAASAGKYIYDELNSYGDYIVEELEKKADKANASGGFVGGQNAKAEDSAGAAIDAIQLGTGTNAVPKTLQVYDYQLLDADGNIPAERLSNAPGGSSSVNVVDNLDSTSTTSALSANQGKVLNEEKANKQTTQGGFVAGEGAINYDEGYGEGAGTGAAIGKNAFAVSGGASIGENTYTEIGGAVGKNAYSMAGGAVGSDARDEGGGGAVGSSAHTSSGFSGGWCAESIDGGAVGNYAKTGSGFAGGEQAKTVDTNDNGIDAIQLGTGTNTTPKTLQVYDYQLLDADGNIPAERLTNSGGVGKSLAGETVQITSTTTATVGDYTEIFNDYRDRTFNSLGYAAQGNLAINSYSHAEGKGTTAFGYYSHAEGSETYAGAASAHAEGDRTKANGNYSHAEGAFNEASGECSHTEGYGTYAGGNYSHAEGNGSSCGGNHSHAEGYRTKANGNHSHAEGYNTQATGYCSHAEGCYTQAIGYFQHVHGKYNKISNGATGESDTTGDIFIIGNGTSESNRTNALRTTTAGKTYGAQAFSGSGADYAEFFEWQDGNPNEEDRRGLFVTLDGEKIRKAANEDDYILGVVSVNACFEGDSQSEAWKGMYLKDVFGEKVTEVIEVPETTDEETGVVIPAHTETRWVLNDEYDPDEEYVPRENRKEWSAVGLIGKLVVVDDGTCEVNGYCKPSADGIGTKSNEKTAYRVMERLDNTHVRVVVK